jgi:hypothetical protein
MAVPKIVEPGMAWEYEFLNMHLYALFYYRKVMAMLRPNDARMWGCAVDLCFVALHNKIPDAIRVGARRYQGHCDPETGYTLLSRGSTVNPKAAQCYLRRCRRVCCFGPLFGSCLLLAVATRSFASPTFVVAGSCGLSFSAASTYRNFFL